MSNRKDNKGEFSIAEKASAQTVVTRLNTPIGWEKPALSIRGL